MFFQAKKSLKDKKKELTESKCEIKIFFFIFLRLIFYL